MAKKGDGHREGAVKSPSQLKNPVTWHFIKRDAETGPFMDGNADKKPFKGVKERILVSA